jgi:hypothetical protein
LFCEIKPGNYEPLNYYISLAKILARRENVLFYAETLFPHASFFINIAIKIFFMAKHQRQLTTPLFATLPVEIKLQ